VKVALITGISGQDGAYLAKLLLENGYRIVGTSRDAEIARFANLERLGIRDGIKLESAALNDFRSVIQVLSKVQPDEIYNLAEQSSVSLSFQQPVETQESIHLATLNLLEAIRFSGKPIRLYNASSSECFGDLGNQAADETAPFRPRNQRILLSLQVRPGNWRTLSLRLSIVSVSTGRSLRTPDEQLLRPTEIMIGRGNASKAEQKLGWKAKYHMEDVVRMMAEAVEGKNVSA
jgi:GDP-D-mannose dehydratase